LFEASADIIHSLELRVSGFSAVLAHHVLVPARDVLAEKLQPLDAGHDLEVALEGCVQLAAVDHRPLAAS